jgi:hypothetical protein
MDGGPGIRVELGEADFFDLHHSAFFNSLPVARDGLLTEGAAAREYTMRFVRVPELTAEPAWQRYEPPGNPGGALPLPRLPGRHHLRCGRIRHLLPGLSRTGRVMAGDSAAVSDPL